MLHDSVVSHFLVTKSQYSGKEDICGCHVGDRAILGQIMIPRYAACMSGVYVV